MNLWFTLHMDLDNPEGPGWYLSATRQDDPNPEDRVTLPVQLIPPTRLDSVNVKEIGSDLDDYLGVAEIQVLPSQIVSSGVHLIQEAISRELKKAEEAAVRAAKLKALQEAESPTDKDKDVE